MDNTWQLCRTIGPLLIQKFPLASAKAQPRGDLFIYMKNRAKIATCTCSVSDGKTH